MSIIEENLMSKLNFGIVGAGAIAHSCCKAINDHPEARVLAASDPNEERLQGLKEKNNITNTYATNEELFGDAELDAVYIAVPNKFHAPLAIAALNAGKHVILDKPFALSYAEAKEVAYVAAANGKTFTVGMNQRFTPGVQQARSLIKQGDLGEVYHAKSFWFRRKGIPKFGTWFCRKDMAGGGVMLDIGVHLLDATLYVLDNFEPVSVTGQTYTKFGDRGLGEGGWGMSDAKEQVFDVDDFSTALIKFKNGASVSLDVSWAIHQKESNKMDIQIYGTEGGMLCYGQEKFNYGEGSSYSVQQGLNGKKEFEHGDRFHNFINHILGKEELCNPIEQALVIQKILDGIYESSKTGNEVKLD
ncbi:MAG: oxidoreductase [Planctomycetota bacterium]|nr:MAG: oxidoreductase [Planctomycetota bacterium]